MERQVPESLVFPHTYSGGKMSKMINLQCHSCDIWFERRAASHQYEINKGSKRTFCSFKCFSLSGKHKEKHCIQCQESFVPNALVQKFCSHSCAATHSNTGRQRANYHSCPGCGFDTPSRQIYCSGKCKKDHQLTKWLSGEELPASKWCSVPQFIRTYIMEQSWYQCSWCGWAEIHPITGKVPLQVDHIDGDCSNNSIKNLRVLCPNCHSLTETFGSLNSESQRKEKKKRRQAK